MAKMTKTQLIDAIAEGTQISKGDVKQVIEHMATIGYKELNESGEFTVPGFVKMSVAIKPATEARTGVNPFTKEPMEFAAKPASKKIKGVAAEGRQGRCISSDTAPGYGRRTHRAPAQDRRSSGFVTRAASPPQPIQAVSSLEMGHLAVLLSARRGNRRPGLNRDGRLGSENNNELPER